jgi:hypothetical protein
MAATKEGRKCRNWAVDDNAYCHLHGGRAVPKMPEQLPGIPMSWVALWVWGYRGHYNPCKNFFDGDVCIRPFVAFRDQNFPPGGVDAKEVQAGDTAEVRLDGATEMEERLMRQLILARLTTHPG